MGGLWTRAWTTVETALNQGSVRAHSSGAKARQGVRVRLLAVAVAVQGAGDGGAGATVAQGTGGCGLQIEFSSLKYK